MTYAMYSREPYGEEELQIVDDIELQKIMVDILLDDAEIEEDLIIELTFDEIVDLFVDTLEEGIDYFPISRVWVVDEKGKTIIDWE